ncbi:MAG: HAD-IC family P-type ATPase [Sphingomicrobium sp.]
MIDARQQYKSDEPVWHAVPPARCLQLLGSSARGLSAAEARDRLARHGPNSLPRRRGLPLGLLFVRQFRNPLIYLLLAATLISVSLGHLSDAGFIAIVLLLNAIVGTVQERRAATSMDALDKLIRHKARVRRDDLVDEIEASEVVPGDVVEMESGMAVPADIRLLLSNGLLTDESLLSGESLSVAKDAGARLNAAAGLADRTSMLHAGTTISEGRGTGVVVATGLATELGRIQASLDQSTAEPPPLLLQLRTLARHIAIAAVGLIAILSLLLALDGHPMGQILLLAVALAVSAIPEGLPIAVTVALTAATRQMAGRNVIVRALPAVEGLGSCTLIASDKTGTLTLNRLSLERILLPHGQLLAPADWAGAPGPDVTSLAAAAAYCNEVAVGPGGMLIGDTVDVALAHFARSTGINLVQAIAAERRFQLAYEPANRFSAVMIGEAGIFTFYVKGAPDSILPMCRAVPATLAAQADALAQAGYRVLALASAEIRDGEIPDHRDLHGMRLLGWVALLDPVRPEAPSAIARCAAAGISVRMVTGDHPATARTIAAQLGLSCSAEQLVTGAEIAELAHDDQRLVDIVRGGRVFARIDPRQKLRIVQLLTAGGEIVAVTGDGANDAPALQAAHIGVAMGQGGTDVARSSADLVLVDDNFASIVAGIEEGRIAYANIRKIVIFLLATGIAEIAMFLGAVAMGLPMPLTAVQLLWLNLVTNGAQDVMLGFGRGEGDELQQGPRRPSEPILNRSALALMIPPALAMTVLALLMITWADARSMPLAEIQNGVLLLVVFFQNAYVICMRSERRPLWREPLMSNPWLLLGVALTLGLQLLAMNWRPLQNVLGTAPVDGFILAVCIAGAAVTIVVTETTKWVMRRA